MNRTYETDRKIKSIIVNNDDFKFPDSLDERLECILDSLPDSCEGRIPAKHRAVSVRTLQKILIIAALLGACTLTAFAAGPKILEMTANFIDQLMKIDSIGLVSQKEQYERFNAVTDDLSHAYNGVTVSVENIAVDDNYMMIVSQIHYEDMTVDEVFHQLYDMDKVGREWYDPENPESNLIFISPYYRFKVDGGEPITFQLIEWDNYYVDDSTFVAVYRYRLEQKLPDIFKLTLCGSEIGGFSYDWELTATVDKSNTSTEALTALPDIEAQVTSMENGKAQIHEITIEKVSLSPFGGFITIGESSIPGNEPFNTFVLRDNNGNYCTVVSSSLSVGNGGSNTFEFIYPYDMELLKSLTLIPITVTEEYEECRTYHNSGPLPDKIELSKTGGYYVDSFEQDADGRLIIRMEPYGAIMCNRNLTNGAFALLDRNGQSMSQYYEYSEGYDKVTGELVFSIEFKDNAPADIMENIGGFFHIRMGMMLNEDQRIEIKIR